MATLCPPTGPPAKSAPARSLLATARTQQAMHPPHSLWWDAWQHVIDEVLAGREVPWRYGEFFPLRGVTRIRDKFKSQGRVNGELTYFGVFETPEAAHAEFIRQTCSHAGKVRP